MDVWKVNAVPKDVFFIERKHSGNNNDLALTGTTNDWYNTNVDCFPLEVELYYDPSETDTYDTLVTDSLNWVESIDFGEIPTSSYEAYARPPYDTTTPEYLADQYHTI